MQSSNKKRCVLRLVEAIMKNDKKGADKALKVMINNNIGAKIKRAGKTESLL